jgi:hypothetical protein
MRRGPHLAAGLLLVAACTSTPTLTNDQFRSTAPSFPTTLPEAETASTQHRVASIPGQLLGPGSTRGVLPDGTSFDVSFEPSRVEWLTGVSGTILVDLPGGTSPSAGTLTFSRRQIESGWVGESYRISAGSDSVELEVDDSIVDVLGAGYQAVFDTAIEGKQVSGYPVLQLSPPLRWAEDDETSDPMQVRFGSFLVRRGCGDLAAACSPTHTLQVIPIELLSPEAPPWPPGQVVSIESSGTRSVSDP